MAIFNSYVKLPEGRFHWQCCFNYCSGATPGANLLEKNVSSCGCMIFIYNISHQSVISHQPSVIDIINIMIIFIVMYQSESCNAICSVLFYLTSFYLYLCFCLCPYLIFLSPSIYLSVFLSQFCFYRYIFICTGLLQLLTFPAPAPYEPVRSTYEQKSGRGVKTDKDLLWKSCGVVGGRRGRQRSSAEIGQLLLPSLKRFFIYIYYVYIRFNLPSGNQSDSGQSQASD